MWPLLLSLLILEIGAASEPAEVVSATRGLRFDEPAYHFGRVRGGELVSHDFTFTNPSSKPVEIGEVKPSCGCLAIGNWPTRVEAGASGTIPVHFATANYAGHVSETVTVTYTDPTLPPITLRVEVTVWWPIEVTPRAAVFEFGANSGTNAFKVVGIVNHEGAPLHLGAPQSSQRALAATLRTNTPGREFELTVRALPPLPAGNIYGQVKLLTSSTSMPVLEIPVYAFAQPDVVVTPSRLILPGGPIREKLQQTLSIQSFWTNALELSSPAINAESVALRIEPVESGRSYQVTLTYPEGFATPPPEKLELKIETNHPRYRIIRVPVSQEPTPYKER